VGAAASDDGRFEATLERFDAAHREDPRSIVVDGVAVPWSAQYHRRLRHWVERLDPEASEPLRLAAACQHIRRWEVPRSDYDEGRRGYRRWRSDLSKRHAEIARGVLSDVGYDEDTIVRVETFLQKIGLARDPEVQLFEDAICMVFFEMDYTDLVAKHDDEKMIDILRRTWAKMSPIGHEAALALAEGLPERERRLIEGATAELA
jgi:hypothetical protein